MGKVYVIGNFKGGVGKTKTVTMLAYESALHLGRKTLVIDLDPQGNATRVLAKTGDLDEITYTVTEAFQEGSLEPAITNISENLDLIPANTAFRNLTKILMTKFPSNEFDQINYLNTLLKPLKEKYDAIYIDVPPTISDFSDNAMLGKEITVLLFFKRKSYL